MTVRELESPPGLTGLYGKAALGALPGIGRGGDGLPDTELVVSDVEIDRGNLAEYDRVCGFTVRDELPATYPHIIAFPLAMELMTSSEFPFSVIGLVHIGNHIELLRPIRADEKLGVRVKTDHLSDHPRGRQFHIHASAEVGGERVWKSVSTYLHKEKTAEGPGSEREEERPQPPEPKAVWKLGGDTGRRYAAVSGDRNPIHMSRVSAKLFGMKRPIAHGMWAKARCLAALEGELPEAYAVDVSFKLPVFLPGNVSFASWESGAGREFALHDGRNEKPHLTGSVSPL